MTRPMNKSGARPLASLCALALAALALPAAAIDYPGARPIEMTVLFGAGSAADVTARHLADGMARHLATAIDVVNRTGGGGAAGYTHVAKQRPDGYSIIWNSNSISTNYYSGVLPFDYHAFDPVARVSVEVPMLAVRADAPWKTLDELVDYAKAHPGKLRVGNSGIGSHTHFVASALFAVADAKETEVPFGQGQAVVNLLVGRIEATVQMPAAVLAHVKANDVRVLAALGSRRDAAFPDIPTAQEQGYNIALDLWRGIAVPKDTPKPIIASLEHAVEKTVKSPEFEEAGNDIGFTPAFLPAAQFGDLIASDDARLGKVMAELGFKKR